MQRGLMRLTRRVNGVILLSFAVQAHGSADRHVDEWLGNLISRAHKVAPRHSTGIDSTALGKTAAMVAQHRGELAVAKGQRPAPHRTRHEPRARSDSSHRFPAPPFVRRPMLHNVHRGVAAWPLKFKSPATVAHSASTEVQSDAGASTEDLEAAFSKLVGATSADAADASGAVRPQMTPQKALQIVEVNTDSDEVKVRKDNLQTIQDNLKALGVDRVSVVSVMGAYRTGKSFLLDLMLRYLDNFSASDASISGAPSTRREDGDEKGRFEVPNWLQQGGDLSREGGFAWREGQERCTQGVWIWSKPYLRETTVMEGGKERKMKTGILLMDTQGAWDSKMTAQQSATIFGLTTALSSKQIFNIQNRIGEDSLKALDYFANMAVAAERLVQQGTASAQPLRKSPGKPFQELQILVRDWVNFDDDTFDFETTRLLYNVSQDVVERQRWPVDVCLKQMDIHYQDHFGIDVVDRRSVESLNQMFSKLSVFLLPLPGRQVQKSKSWNGDVTQIDEDFLRFLDQFMRNTFTAEVSAQKVMGQDIPPDRFADVVGTLSDAFEGMGFTSDSMVSAVGKATNLLAQDSAEKVYKKEMDSMFKNPTQRQVPEAQLEALNEKARELALREYAEKAIFGDATQISMTQDALKERLDASYAQYKRRARRRMGEALNFLAPVASGGVGLFALDRLSDFTCDWWNPWCQSFSADVFGLYGPVFAGMALYTAYAYQNETSMTTATAVLELLNEMKDFSKVKAAELSDLSGQVKARIDTVNVSQVKQQLTVNVSDLTAPR